MVAYNNSQQVQERRKNQLSEALAEIRSDWGDNINKPNSNTNNFVNSYNSAYSNAGGTGNGFNTLGKTLAGMGSGSSNGFGTIGNAIKNYISGSGNSSSAISDAINSNINGTGNSGSLITDAINNNINSGSTGLSGGSSGGGTPWGLIGGIAKKGYNSISGHDDKDYSDTEESIVYPLQGASMGAQFGPWGAAAGAMYGLGYSFKDDLGLKDSNFLTQMLFPIGMGDGGGLRVGGKSILDLG